jgi:hypothetical protein
LATFITISEGDEAAEAHQLLVIDDPDLAIAIRRMIAHRIVGGARVRALRSLPSDADKERE